MKKITLLSAIALSINLTLNAQIIDPGQTVKNKTTDKVNQKTDEAVDAGLNKIEEGIGSIFKKKTKSNAENSNQNSGSNSTNNQENDETDFSEYEGSTFVPGKEVLFFEDFISAKIGSGNGNWFVNNWDTENPAVITKINGSENNWMKITRYGHFYPNQFKSLPQNCTIEFDMFIDSETVSEMQSGLRFSFVAREDRENFDLHFNDQPEVMVDIHPYGIEGFLNIFASREYGLDENLLNFYNKTFKNAWNVDEINRVALLRENNSVKIFINGKEQVHLPKAFLKNSNYNFMMSSNQWGNGIYITNIRVGRNVQNATNEIKTDGKFVTNAIYFDTNSSKIKPESWATLNQAAQAIKTTSGNILIVGHTDSDGADEANLILSKNRAQSMKNALIQEFDIEESRLQIDGKGETEALNNNKNASEKAQNRRVEFIKI